MNQHYPAAVGPRMRNWLEPQAFGTAPIAESSREKRGRRGNGKQGKYFPDLSILIEISLHSTGKKAKEYKDQNQPDAETKLDARNERSLDPASRTN